MLPLPAKPVFSPTSTYWLNARAVFQACRAEGASNPFAVGVMANLDMETAFKSTAVGDGGTAFNLEQWHPDRIARILKGTGIDLKTQRDIRTVIRASFWEMQNVPPYQVRFGAMQVAPTAGQVAELFCQYIEGAGASDASARRAQDAAFWTVAITQHADFFAQAA